MIAYRLPVWRTNPAGFGVSGYWPFLTILLTMLFIPPLVGLILIAASTLNLGQLSWGGEQAGIIVMWSPLFSWIVLLGAIPASHFAARAGFSGWGVAVIGGLIVGFLMAFVLDGVSPVSAQETPFVAICVPFALMYWGVVRVMRPTAIGISFWPDAE